MIKNERKLYLKSKLKQLHLSFRDDSILCKDYINYRRHDINFIINMMMEMNYFYKYTNYPLNMSMLKNMYSNNFINYSYNNLSELAKIKTLEEIMNSDNINCINQIPDSVFKRLKSKLKLNSSRSV